MGVKTKQVTISALELLNKMCYDSGALNYGALNYGNNGALL